jgi:O-antigen ligase
LDSNVVLAAVIVGGGIYAIVVLRWPYLGLVGAVASLPVTLLLPDVGVFTSIVPIIGLVTLIGFLLQSATHVGRALIQVRLVSILALLLIAWIFISNPYAAWFGRTRNWVLTYAQLWVLAWLASELLDTPKKHHVLMAAYSIAVVVSAVGASRGASLGQDIYSSIRVPGFTDGANTASRYFAVGLVFMNYLRTTTQQRRLRVLLVVGMLVAVLGVFSTVSRTGMLLLVVAVVLALALNARGRNQGVLVTVVVIGFLMLSWASDNLTNIVKSILPSVVEGSDTVGLRYRLWMGAWRMWLANPIAGVGVGLYVDNLRTYASDLLSGMFLRLPTHSMYLQVLAEMGAVGFILFVSMLAVAIASIWRARKTFRADEPPVWIPWFIAFAVMLLGGITKSDQYDKLVWLGVGIGWHFANRLRESVQKGATIPTVHSLGPAPIPSASGGSLTASPPRSQPNA